MFRQLNKKCCNTTRNENDINYYVIVMSVKARGGNNMWDITPPM